MKKTEYETIVNRAIEKEVSRLAGEVSAAGAARAEDLLGVVLEQIPVTCARVTTTILREAGLLEYDPE